MIDPASKKQGRENDSWCQSLASSHTYRAMWTIHRYVHTDIQPKTGWFLNRQPRLSSGPHIANHTDPNEGQVRNSCTPISKQLESTSIRFSTKQQLSPPPSPFWNLVFGTWRSFFLTGTPKLSHTALAQEGYCTLPHLHSSLPKWTLVQQSLTASAPLLVHLHSFGTHPRPTSYHHHRRGYTETG